MLTRIDVLDHGVVRLVDHMGSDLSIVRSARVSYDAAWREDAGAGKNKTGDAKLIEYLMKNRHTTPFEAVQFTFEIKCPIFVARQWHRHRTQSFNEVSARYTPLPEVVYIPEASQIGVLSRDNKQGRDISKDSFEATALAALENMREMMIVQNKSAFKTYNDLLDAGMPRELARSVLPVGTYTHFFTSVNLHNLYHFMRLRLHEHAQYEIRVYAQAMLDLIEPIVPVATAAFKETL